MSVPTQYILFTFRSENEVRLVFFFKRKWYEAFVTAQRTLHGVVICYKLLIIPSIIVYSIGSYDIILWWTRNH
jgi:hypothetical protein